MLHSLVDVDRLAVIVLERSDELAGRQIESVNGTGVGVVPDTYFFLQVFPECPFPIAHAVAGARVNETSEGIHAH
jgi:hypothetical protein